MSNTKQISFEDYQKAVEVVKSYQLLMRDKYKDSNNKKEGLHPFTFISKETKISQSNISIRLQYALRSNKDALGLEDWNNVKVKDLSKISLFKIRTCRAVGARCLKELNELCSYTGIKLKP